MGTIETAVEEQKGRMRKQAIAKRRTVNEAERAKAGERLAAATTQALRWFVTEPATTPATNPMANPFAKPTTGRTAKLPTTPITEASEGAIPNSAETTPQKQTEAAANNAAAINRDNEQPEQMRTISLSAGDTIAAYVSMGTEVPTLGLLDALVEHGLRVLVPRLGRGRDIGWSEYLGSRLLRDMPRTSRGGLRPSEPESEALGPDAIANAKIALIPAFAIDLDGTRLGRGGGWYDQALGCLPADALKIGVCWDWELIDGHDAVPREPHDIPVDAVLTPERIVWF
ncbi:5-formyltetrahydrofolate cyclo-ligase [Bifidobacterium sp. ESL0790]|uniref:5-formyltetrahydrofolate cyclo-ligase n=1 Tax=Bifidobacterium sp. ESL0790 TaxID=2983233 RepID=UPI0023F9F009|nr:5-formyltetrahydrofolate cyclo-ligase [Bifidobacterium sp. ESL0790]WEV72175.1 5-formyltetrahydrofolate cyclo-ligase [Bifidobacterium sp. ESL0790]